MNIGQHVYAVILAGGEGVRFAPLSTPSLPKQFIKIFNDRTLIQQTVDRISDVVAPERVIVATNERYLPLIAEQLPAVPRDNILLETARRNTAPAIAAAAHWLMARDPDALMAVLPSDHVILARRGFLETLSFAAEFALRERNLVTLGITPTEPSTQYGYIRRGVVLSSIDKPVYSVDQFVEKPDEITAIRYLACGEYYWNSGMFVWTVRSILEEISHHLPAMHAILGQADFFDRAQSISIDYGVLERSGRCVVIPSSFGWSDIGSWGSLKALVKREGLAVHPDVRRYLDQLA